MGYLHGQRGSDIIIAKSYFEMAYDLVDAFSNSLFPTFLQAWLDILMTGFVFVDDNKEILSVGRDLIEKLDEVRYRGNTYTLVMGHLGEFVKNYIYDLDMASTYLQKAIESASVTGQVINYGYYSILLGEVYKLKGEYEQAKVMYVNAIGKIGTTSKAVHRNMFHIYGLYHIIDLLIDQFPEEREEIQHYYQLMEETSQHVPETAHWYIFSLLGRGLYHKYLKRIDSLFYANQLFEEIVDRDNQLDHPKLIALLNLCEILAIELQLANDIGLLDEIRENVDKIQELSQQSNMLPLQVDTIIIHARIELIKKNFERADELLEQAMDLTNEANLSYLQDKVKTEQHSIVEIIDSHQAILLKNQSLKEKLTELKLEEYIKMAKHMVWSDVE